jgi:pyruvate,orthophosphate dikinase
MCKATIVRKAENILDFDPFIVLDREGVGAMMKLAIQEGRQTRPDIKLGICGEHGGDPSSVEFCHQLGLQYVSCSPYRVPIARLAAAQSAVSAPQQKGKKSSSSKIGQSSNKAIPKIRAARTGTSRLKSSKKSRQVKSSSRR